MKVVLDSNVLVSAFLNPRGLAARVLDEWFDEKFELVTSSTIVEEVGRTLDSPRLTKGRRIDPVYRSGLTERLAATATQVDLTGERLFIARDEDDNRVIEAAVESSADLIVTNDKDLLVLGEVRGIPIITLHDFALTLGLQH